MVKIKLRLGDKRMEPKRHKSSFWSLLIGSVGVVFGDIGTSPLYAMRETLKFLNDDGLAPENIFSILSLIFWTLVIIVCVKYLLVIMRADNHGEGGTFALLAHIHEITKKTKKAKWATIIGLIGAAFFYGDCMITPAISVLSAIEGLRIIEPGLEVFVIPFTIVVLTFLFWIQSKGTGKVGMLFGPIVCLWFIAIGFLGILQIIKVPQILYGLNPLYALYLLEHHPTQSLLILSTIFLAVTGAEALYADMGHFGKLPIQASWLFLVFPALVLNYFGQGALLLDNMEAIENPFFMLASPFWQGPLVILATLATIIASQAVITGAFSIFRQAVQLDYLPRITSKHTSGLEEGQIYVPFVNWSLYIAVIGLVLYFKTSSHLAGAYGIAVANTMLITTILVTIVMKLKWEWPNWLIAIVATPLLLVDASFVIANSIKIIHGGWFSLMIGILSFLILITWKRGRLLVVDQINRKGLPLENFIADLDDTILRPRGTAIILTGNTMTVPHSLLQYTKLSKSLHTRIIIVTVATEEIPYVSKRNRTELKAYEKGIFRLIIRYGFMQIPNVPKALAQCDELGLLDHANISYFLSRSVIIPNHFSRMASWRKHLFAFMTRNATNATDFFKIPSERAIELGMRVDL